LKGAWWKITAILLLIYSITAGLFVRLGPGILNISPSIVSTDSVISLKVSAYHTHFNFQSEKSKFWLVFSPRNKDEKQVEICAFRTTQLTDTSIQLYFQTNTGLPFDFRATDSFIVGDLIINTAADGNIVLPDAVVIQRTNKYQTGGKQACVYQVSSEKAKYFNFPFRNSLYETVRNVLFHVPMWFAMMALFGMSLWYSIRYLLTQDMAYDMLSATYIRIGLVFATCGLITGAFWARFTWGKYWVLDDPKLNGAAIMCLMYFAYMVLRGSISSNTAKAKTSAVFNIFAAASVVPLLYIYPNMTSSLHPGNGGNVAFSNYDLNNNLRMVFYPACIAWILIGLWTTNITVRINKLDLKVKLKIADQSKKNK